MYNNPRTTSDSGQTLKITRTSIRLLEQTESRHKYSKTFDAGENVV